MVDADYNRSADFNARIAEIEQFIDTIRGSQHVKVFGRSLNRSCEDYRGSGIVIYEISKPPSCFDSNMSQRERLVAMLEHYILEYKEQLTTL